MAQPPKNRRNLAVIGAGVGVAAAAVVTLLVLRDKPEESATELSARAAALPALPNQPLEGGVVKPWETKQPTPAELAELKKAEAAERDEANAEQVKAEAALKLAEAKSAREQAIEQARQYGILGSTALQQGGAFASLTGTGSSGFDDANIYGGLLGNDKDSNGGFGYGRAGFGPGGGGTGGAGWGTIGTGRYGSIGHGSGRGSGYGRGGGGTKTPTVSVGQPNATGDLDKAIIRRYIKRNIQKIQYCYEKELLAKPQLQGKITVTFTISPAGVVDTASATGVDANASTCIASVVKAIEFPKPKGGGNVSVTYPFIFKPAGSP